MEFLGYLAPIAFIFTLVALSKTNALKKELEELKDEINNKEIN